MAEGKEDLPELREGGGEGQATQSLSERLASVEARADTPDAQSDSQDADPPVWRRPHFVKRPGQMVLGSRMLAPKLRPDQLAMAIERRHIFTSLSGPHRGGMSASAATLLVCALALGAATGLTSLLDTGNTSSAREIAGPADEPGGNLAFDSNAFESGQTEPGRSDTTLVASISPKNVGGQALIGHEADNLQPVQLNAQNQLVVKDIKANMASPTPLDITVQYDSSGGEYAFLMFRGLPEDFRLSAGFQLKGSWAVSLNDLVDLRLVPPQDYQGRFELQVLLVKGRKTPVESRIVKVEFAGGEAQTIARAVPQPTPVPQVLTATPPIEEERLKPRPAGVTAPLIESAAAPADLQQAALAPKQELPMLKRAYTFLDEGDVISARMILEHIAKKGSGKGALVLAQTYDPLFFSKMYTLGGPKADPAMARKWYSLALELGQDGAKARLDSLPRSE